MELGEGGNDLQRQVFEIGRELLPRLRSLSTGELQDLLVEVDTINQGQPLQFMGGAQFFLENWNGHGKLTAIQLIALYVVGLWVQAGENADNGAFLLEKWPFLVDLSGQER